MNIKTTGYTEPMALNSAQTLSIGGTWGGTAVTFEVRQKGRAWAPLEDASGEVSVSANTLIGLEPTPDDAEIRALATGGTGIDLDFTAQ